MREETGNEQASGKGADEGRGTAAGNQATSLYTPWAGSGLSISHLKEDKENSLGRHQGRRDRPSTVSSHHPFFEEAKILGPECHPDYPGQKDALTSPGYWGLRAVKSAQKDD